MKNTLAARQTSPNTIMIENMAPKGRLLFSVLVGVTGLLLSGREGSRNPCRLHTPVLSRLGAMKLVEELPDARRYRLLLTGYSRSPVNLYAPLTTGIRNRPSPRSG